MSSQYGSGARPLRPPFWSGTSPGRSRIPFWFLAVPPTTPVVSSPVAQTSRVQLEGAAARGMGK